MAHSLVWRMQSLHNILLLDGFMSGDDMSRSIVIA